MNWIDATKQLPSVGERVLIAHYGYVDFGHYDLRDSDGGWVDENFIPREVTHWMPVPEAPEVTP